MAEDIPAGAYLHSISATYNEKSIPRDMYLLHPLKAEFWGKVVVDEGEVNLYLDALNTPLHCTPQAPGIIPEGRPYAIRPSKQACRFHVEYYHAQPLDDPTQLASLLGKSHGRRANA